MEAVRTSRCPIFRSLLLGARCSRESRRLHRDQAAGAPGEVAQLLRDFAVDYNAWRPHMTPHGAVPDLIRGGHQWQHHREQRRWFPPTSSATSSPRHASPRSASRRPPREVCSSTPISHSPSAPGGVRATAEALCASEAARQQFHQGEETRPTQDHMFPAEKTRGGISPA